MMGQLAACLYRSSHLLQCFSWLIPLLCGVGRILTWMMAGTKSSRVPHVGGAGSLMRHCFVPCCDVSAAVCDGCLLLSVYVSQHRCANHAVCRRSVHARSRHGRRRRTKASDTVASRHWERCVQVHEEGYEGNEIRRISFVHIIASLTTTFISVTVCQMKLVYLDCFLHIFWKRILGSKWHWFYWPDAITAAEPALTKHWKKLTDPIYWPTPTVRSYRCLSTTGLSVERCSCLCATFAMNIWFFSV